MANDQSDMATAPRLSFRPHVWLDVEALKLIYGIQGRLQGRRKWMHVARNGEPLFFDTAAARDAELNLLRDKQ